jgi:hypothetical protein
LLRDDVGALEQRHHHLVFEQLDDGAEVDGAIRDRGLQIPLRARVSRRPDRPRRRRRHEIFAE